MMLERVNYETLKQWFFEDAYQWCQEQFENVSVKKWHFGFLEWGGAYHQAANAVTNAVSLALTGSPTAGVVAGAASPYVNTAIKETFPTEGENANNAGNILAHAAWGAVEAATQGRSAAAGAVSASAGEITAKVYSEAVLNKKPEELTESEKRQVSEISQTVGALAGGVTSAATGGNSLTTAQNAVTGMGVAKNAVENNAVNKKQSGTVLGFEKFLNNTRTKMGTLKGEEAENALFRLNDLNWNLTPATTGPFNVMNDRYIYTENGGWIDMAHFMFYAGEAYSEKVALIKHRENLNNMNNDYLNTHIPYVPNMYLSDQDIKDKAMNTAIKHGYWQERLDSLYPAAHHSAYSYEDLPTDKFGAEFGAKYFDPKSSSTFGQQISQYLNSLGATEPKNAPNYNSLPDIDDGTHSGIENRTTKPLFTKGGQ